MITVIVMIDVEADRITEAAQQIADLPGVDQVYSCAGDVDLIAISQAADHEAIAELVPPAIAKVAGRDADHHPHRVPFLCSSATPRTVSPSAMQD